ncbi:MAG TPA: hypothetical protein DD670_20430 [Planctomycetaceae bacterium]|nr:hypothetical protein [Planctomycetaceae bacterium]
MDDLTLVQTYHRFADKHDCYLDGILCDPQLREPFLDELREEIADATEAEMLGRLVYLRKSSRLARKKPR